MDIGKLWVPGGRFHGFLISVVGVWDEGNLLFARLLFVGFVIGGI